MSNQYDLVTSDDNLSYQFVTRSGDVYFAYFTSFFLQNKYGEEVEIFSFGFDRKVINPQGHRKFDSGVKATI